MANSEDHHSEFGPHTRLKHLILRTYLQTWAQKLLLRRDAGDAVYYVDACAGRGMDDVGNHGSAVIAAREAAIAESGISARRGTPVIVRTFAIEKRRVHFTALRKALAPFGEKATAIQGELRDHLAAILAKVGHDPLLVFIDPFGVAPLRAEVVRAVLARPHCEVFVLFADQACLRHFGAAAAAERENAPQGEDLFSTAGIDEPPHAEGESDDPKPLQITADAAHTIMNDAFGTPDWFARVERVGQSARRMEFVKMYGEFLHEAGARYVLPIPIRNARNTHVYHLIHATRSATGHIAMKEAVSHALKKTDLSTSAAKTIQFAIRSNLPAIADHLRSQFAGRTVPWTTAENGFGPLKKYVLSETPAYPHELAELKRLLRPLKVANRRDEVYEFPA